MDMHLVFTAIAIIAFVLVMVLAGLTRRRTDRSEGREDRSGQRVRSNAQQH